MNRATERRDAVISRQIQEGIIRLWADGYGVWHASVPLTFAFPKGAAKLAIRLALQERAPRDTWVSPPAVEFVGQDDERAEYKEA